MLVTPSHDANEHQGNPPRPIPSTFHGSSRFEGKSGQPSLPSVQTAVDAGVLELVVFFQKTPGRTA